MSVRRRNQQHGRFSLKHDRLIGGKTSIFPVTTPNSSTVQKEPVNDEASASCGQIRQPPGQGLLACPWPGDGGVRLIRRRSREPISLAPPRVGGSDVRLFRLHPRLAVPAVLPSRLSRASFRHRQWGQDAGLWTSNSSPAMLPCDDNTPTPDWPEAHRHGDNAPSCNAWPHRSRRGPPRVSIESPRAALMSVPDSSFWLKKLRSGPRLLVSHRLLPGGFCTLDQPLCVPYYSSKQYAKVAHTIAIVSYRHITPRLA